MHQFKGFEGDDKLVFAVVVAVIVVVLSLLFVYLRLKRTSKRGVLITGICDSGKTLLFSRLAYGKSVDTHTSVKENVSHYPPGKMMLQLIDIPGHERVRNRYLEEYKASARAVIFVIDSNTFQKEIRDVAEYLYNLLTDRVIMKNCRKFIILCNKQDAPLAKDSKVIKNLLEKELNTLRETKSSGLKSTEGEESGMEGGRLTLGNCEAGGPFTWTQLAQSGGPQLDFAECSLLQEESELPITPWLRSLCI